MDYKNGKIYSIRSSQTDLFYIGSTTQPLCKRLYWHKNGFNQWKKTNKNYTTSYELLKYDDAYMELIEDCPCASKDQLTRREGELIRANKSKCVNCKIEGRTKAGYYQDNKEHLAGQARQYRQDNKEHIVEQGKQYYQDNKAHIAEYNSVKVTCEVCKKEMSRGWLMRHMRKH